VAAALLITMLVLVEQEVAVQGAFHQLAALMEQPIWAVAAVVLVMEEEAPVTI